MKRSNREKTILKLLAFVVFLGLVTEGWDRYSAMKKRLIRDMESKQDEVITYLGQLEGQDPEQYLEEVADIDEALFTARERVIELPTEAEASLIVRQAISESAENSGVTINSINVRKSKAVDEEGELRELRTYFGYDTDLEELLQFFSSFEGKSYYMVIENLSISARQRPKRRPNRKASKRRTPIPQRKTLNGNAIIKSLYVANAEGRISQYEGGGKSVAVDTPEIDTDSVIDPTLQTDPMPGNGLEGLQNPLDTQDDLNATANKGRNREPKRKPGKATEKAQDRAKLTPQDKPKTEKKEPKKKPETKPERTSPNTRDTAKKDREQAARDLEKMIREQDRARGREPTRTDEKIDVTGPDQKAPPAEVKPKPQVKPKPRPRRPMESKPQSLTSPSRPKK